MPESGGAAAASVRMAPFALVWACYFVTMGFWSPYSPLWLQSMGVPLVTIGAIASLQSLTRVVAPYGWGWLADHGAPRVRLVQVAALLSAALAVAMGLLALLPGVGGAAWIAVLVLLIVVLFLANGGVMPVTESLVLAHLHGGPGGGLDARRYGRARVGGSTGFLVASLGGGALLHWIGLPALPWLVALFFVALAVCAAGLPAGHANAAGADAPRVSVWPVMRRPEVAWFFAGTLLTVLSHTALYAFFSLLLVSLGYSKSTIGLIWGAGVAAEIVFFATQGRWLRRATDLRWLHAVALVTAVRFALTAVVGPWLWLLLLVQLSHAITFAAHHSACTSVLARHFPDRLRGRGAALYTMIGYGLPGVIGGVAGGVLVEAQGLESVFWAAAFIGVAAALCYRAAMRHAPGQGAAIAA